MSFENWDKYLRDTIEELNKEKNRRERREDERFYRERTRREHGVNRVTPIDRVTEDANKEKNE